MSKYARLTTHLRSLDHASWTASFAELEEVLGFPLPPSARKYEAWWQPGGTHTQARGWTDAGWTIEKLNLARGWVRFARAIPAKKLGEPNRGARGSTPHGSRLSPPDGPRLATSSSEPPAHAAPMMGSEVSVSVEFAWRSCGQVRLDRDGELQFSTVEDQPGLYCFSFVRTGVSRLLRTSPGSTASVSSGPASYTPMWARLTDYGADSTTTGVQDRVSRRASG